LKNRKIILVFILGSMLEVILSNCSPKGGELILLNESSLVLDSPRISMGEHREKELKPGQWMKSGFDKNNRSFNIEFRIGKADRDKIIVDGVSGNWTILNTFISDLIPINNGETVTITVKNKLP